MIVETMRKLYAIQLRFANWFTALPVSDQLAHLEAEGIENPGDFIGLAPDDFLVLYFEWD